MKTFAIYQINHESNNTNARLVSFADLEDLEGMNIKPTLDMYKKVWEGETEGDGEAACERIYSKFNVSKPEGFRGHSLSVSDVIKIDNQFYYCDSYRFTQINLV